MTNPPPTPTPLEMLVKIHNQNVETIKQLRGINSKLTFFVVVLIIAFVLQFLASLLTLGS
jgi:hypothetical protein